MSVLSDEHKLLKETAARFVSNNSPVSALRVLRDAEDAEGFDRGLWKQMATLGWAGLLVPQAYGGSEFGYTGIGVVLEETGRTLMASPLLTTALIGAVAIERVGTPQQKQRLLPALASGDHLIALAHEEGTRHAPFRIETTATPTDDGYVLSGRKRFVLDGHVADTLIVVARTGETGDDRDGLSFFLVDPQAEGVSIERATMVDSRNAANIELENVSVSRDAVLGGVDLLGNSAAALDAVLDVARIGLAAEMLGGINEAFERTLAYLKLRDQFGVKIGSFQALKHRAAVMFTEVEIVTSAVREALSALDDRSEEVSKLASLAKAKANEIFFLVSNESIQMHGGIGMTDEEEIGFFLKRARVAQHTFGDDRFHRDRYARLCAF